MASIQKIGESLWRVQIYRHGQRRSSTFKAEADAKRWAAKIEGRIDATDTLALSCVPRRILEAIATVPYSLAEVQEAAIPVDHMIGIYFLLEREEVVYVGQSATNILGRIAKHQREGKKFDAFAYMRCDIEDIDAMEEKYILAFMPKGNYSTGSSRPRQFVTAKQRRGRPPTPAIPVWMRPGYVEPESSTT
jgi:hypothetical protein